MTALSDAPKLWEKFDGSTGLAVLFLLLITIDTQNKFLAVSSSSALILYGITKGITKPIVKDAEGNLEERFKQSGEELTEKFESDGFEQYIFYVLMICAGLLLLIETSVFFLGIYLFLTSGVVFNEIITIVWILFSLDLIVSWVHSLQLKSFREFTVKFDKLLPGKTILTKEED